MLFWVWHEKQGKLKECRSLPKVSSAVYFKTLILLEYPTYPPDWFLELLKIPVSRYGPSATPVSAFTFELAQ